MTLRLLLFVCALVASMGLPPTARAMAQSHAQQAERAATGVPAPASARPPLFQVRYVLVSALPSPHDVPPIDVGDDKPAIRPFTVSDAPGVLLQGGLENPNVIVCRGWSCMDAPRR